MTFSKASSAAGPIPSSGSGCANKLTDSAPEIFGKQGLWSMSFRSPRASRVTRSNASRYSSVGRISGFMQFVSRSIWQDSHCSVSRAEKLSQLQVVIAD